MHRILTVAIGTAMLSALGACSSISKHVFTAPVVTFRGATVRGIGFTGTALDIYLGVQNPNSYGLKAVGAEYHVFVRDSVEVGSGATHDTVAVGAHDSTIVKLPLDVRWAGLGSAGVQALMSGLVDYRITGDVVAATPFGTHTFPLNARGRVRSDGTPVTTGAQQ